MKRLVILCAALVLGAGSALAQPRIAPVAESAWSTEQREMAATYWKGPVSNDLRTLMAEPTVVRGLMPFANYIMNETTLSPRQRELLILRTAWLSGSNFLWGKHSARAAAAGLSPAEVQRIAQGPDASGWSPFEAALLRAADELHRDSFISTPTWTTLGTQFSKLQLIDTTFTVAEFTMLAGTLNSLRVEPDAGFAPFPANVPRPKAGARGYQPLATPRIPPLAPEEWTPAVRTMLDPTGGGKPVIGVIRTFAQHPGMFVPRQTISDHIRNHTTLAPRLREMLILRILYRCGGHGEWGLHVPGGKAAGLTDAQILQLATPGYAGWNESDGALVRAVDEIYENDRVSDATWKALSTHFDQRQVLGAIVTAGGYRMVAMAINTFGVPLEPGRERIPTLTP